MKSKINVNLAGPKWSTLSWKLKVLIIDEIFNTYEIYDKSMIILDDNDDQTVVVDKIPVKQINTDPEADHPKYHLYLKAWKELSDIRINRVGSPDYRKLVNAKNTLANSHARKYGFNPVHRDSNITDHGEIKKIE